MTQRSSLLREWIRSAKLVLFDFDGPLCDVFAGYPASQVARELESVAGESFDTDDPLEVLRQLAARGDQSVTADVEDALIAAEVRAASRSVATPGGLEALRQCLNVGLRVGIVSNNSGDAVGTFLKRYDLENAFPVVGRHRRHPELMKPDTWPIRNALALTRCSVEESVFVGDSQSDIEVAHAVSMRCVAYANKLGKRDVFDAAGALTIDAMSELVAALPR